MPLRHDLDMCGVHGCVLKNSERDLRSRGSASVRVVEQSVGSRIEVEAFVGAEVIVCTAVEYAGRVVACYEASAKSRG